MSGGGWQAAVSQGSDADGAYLSVSDAGVVSSGPTGTAAFTMAPAPVKGPINARWALDTMDGKRISLWGGPSLGWMTANPDNFFKTGGEVVSRTAKLNQGEQITLSVLDARAGRVALKSDHNL